MCTLTGMNAQIWCFPFAVCSLATMVIFAIITIGSRSRSSMPKDLSILQRDIHLIFHYYYQLSIGAGFRSSPPDPLINVGSGFHSLRRFLYSFSCMYGAQWLSIFHACMVHSDQFTTAFSRDFCDWLGQSTLPAYLKQMWPKQKNENCACCEKPLPTFDN